MKQLDRSLSILSFAAFAILFLGVFKLLASAAPGDATSLNLNFPPTVSARASAVDKDGKILVGGSLRNSAGQQRGLMRFNADGSTDASFPWAGFIPVSSVAIDSKDQIVFGTAVVQRLSPVGYLDPVISATPNGSVHCVLVDTYNNEIFFGGSFGVTNPGAISSPAGIGRIISGSTVNGVARIDGAFSSITAQTDGPLLAIRSMVRQSNGGLLVGGNFTRVNGGTRGGVMRFYGSTGGVDLGFTPNITGGTGVHTLALQSEGKVLVGGTFTHVAGNPRAGLVRLNTNGTVDSAFVATVPSGGVSSIAVQADGKVIIGGNFTSVSDSNDPAPRNRIARFHPNGLLDSSFNPGADGSVQSLTLQADGKLLVGGEFSNIGGVPRRAFAQLENDPASSVLDVTAGGVVWTRSGSAPEVSRVRVEKSIDGGLTWISMGIAARIGSSSNWQRSGFLTLSGAGIVRVRGDAGGQVVEHRETYSFPVIPPTVTPGNVSLSTTTALLEISGTHFTPTSAGNTVTFHPSGTTGTVVFASETRIRVNLSNLVPGPLSVVVNASGESSGTPVQVATVFSFLPGSVAPFSADVFGINGSEVSTSLVQRDGKIIIAGNFTHVKGQPRKNIARFNVDGTLDATYAPQFDDNVRCGVLLPDGSAVFGGWFSNVGSVRAELVRLDASGNLIFSDNLFGVRSLVLQSDGKILAATSWLVIRYNEDLTYDPTFTPLPLSPGADLKTLALDPIGRIIVGGVLSPEGTGNFYPLLRLNTDGTIDSTFYANVMTANYAGSISGRAPVTVVAVQPDGKILVGGPITYPATRSLIRLESTGAHDSTFNAFTIFNEPESLVVQADGKVLVGGRIRTTTLPQKTGLVRLLATGGLDTTFAPNFSGPVKSITPHPDGDLLIGGEFSSAAGHGESGWLFRPKFARIQYDAPTSSLTSPTPNLVAWSRSGTAPFVANARIEWSRDGQTWHEAGTAAYDAMAEGLQATLASPLIGIGKLRATALVPSGLGNGSGSPVFAQGSFDHPLTPPTVAPALPYFSGFIPDTAAAINIYGTHFSPIPQENTVQFFQGGVTGTVISATESMLVVKFNSPLSRGPLEAVVTVNYPGSGSVNSGTPVQVATVVAPGDLILKPLEPTVNASANAAIERHLKRLVGGSFSSANGVPRSNLARFNADGSVDAGFNPALNGTIFGIAEHVENKALIVGSFTTFNGTTRNRIARLNADDTLDAGFNPNANGSIHAVAVQAEGKIVVGGTFTIIGEHARQNIARLNADGTVDSTFSPSANDRVETIAIQGNGHILIGGRFTEISGETREHIARLTPSGSLDLAWNPDANGDVHTIAVQADGGVVFGGAFTHVDSHGANIPRAHLARMKPEGTHDAAFYPKPNGAVFSIAVQTDGGLVVGGDLTELRPFNDGPIFSRPYIAGLTFNGAVSGFDPRANGTVRCVSLDANGSVFIGGDFTTVQPNGSAAPVSAGRMASLLNTPASSLLGAPAANYLFWSRAGSAPEVSQVVFERSIDNGATWIALGSGSRAEPFSDWEFSGAAFSGSGLLRVSGRTVGGFGGASSKIVTDVIPYNFPPRADLLDLTGTISATAVQPDGSTLIGGTFWSVRGVLRNRIARLNPDLSVDATFNPDANDAISSFVILPDGKIMVGGYFTSIGGGAREHIARLNSDGTLDTTFNAEADNQVTAIVAQPDGNFLIAGTFENVNGKPRSGIARLQPDGTLDDDFAPVINGVVLSLALQSDDKIIIGGNFTDVDGAPRNRAARLLKNGTLDGTFNPNVGGVHVNCVVIEHDGNILLAGEFTSVGGTPRGRIARVSATGALDSSFDPQADNAIFSIALQADGNIIIGGAFSALAGNPQNYLARLLPSGAVDPLFAPSPDAPVSALALEADGTLAVAGAFTEIAGVQQSGFIRLQNSSTQSLEVLGPTSVRWILGDTMPDLSEVTLERSLNGLTWTQIGVGARASINKWEFTGLSLIGEALLRVRGVTRSGYYNSSSGRIEAQTSYNFPLPFITPTYTDIPATETSISLTGELPNISMFTLVLTPAPATPGAIISSTPTSATFGVSNLQPGPLYAAFAYTLDGITFVSHSPIQIATVRSGIEMWRYSYFGTFEAIDDAADTADLDGDGLVNLVEYAFGLSPVAPGSTLPVPTRNGQVLTYSFTTPPGVSGVTYGAEWSTTLAPGSWLPVPDTGTGNDHVFSVDTGSTKAFIRLTVTLAP